MFSPKMTQAATWQDLRAGFEEHLTQTKERVAPIEKMFKALRRLLLLFHRDGGSARQNKFLSAIAGDSPPRACTESCRRAAQRRPIRNRIRMISNTTPRPPLG